MVFYAYTLTVVEPMTVAERVDMVKVALAEGKTVYFCNYAGATVLTPKNAAKFAANGMEPVKASKDGSKLLVVNGRGYNNHSYDAIRIA